MQQLGDFCAGRGSGLMFVRGRRRVGKTWLLQTLAKKLGRDGFRVLCRRHRRDSVVLREIIDQWADDSGRPHLKLVKTSALTWKMLFDDIGQHAARRRAKTKRPFVLIIDEVQWLSTSYEEVYRGLDTTRAVLREVLAERAGLG